MYILGTGPSFDHSTSTASGHYFYLEANEPAGAASVARLITYPIAPSLDCSFTFYSHMYGKDIGSLNVLVRSVRRWKMLLRHENL